MISFVDFFSDRCRTTNNLLGDCYGAAVVEALSKKELIAMDKAAEDERNKELEADLEGGHETIVKKVKKVFSLMSETRHLSIYNIITCHHVCPPSDIHHR